MVVYVLTRLELEGEGHFISHNIGATLDEREAEQWKNKDLANSYDALPVILDQSIPEGFDTSAFLHNLNILMSKLELLSAKLKGENHV